MTKTIDFMEHIEKKLLLSAINNATLVLFEVNNFAETSDRNSLFGSTDYLIHTKDDIIFARNLLTKLTKEISYFDLKQNINYYRNGILFDTIVYSGYRGGYKFAIGFNTGKKLQKSDSGEKWNELMTTYF